MRVICKELCSYFIHYLRILTVWLCGLCGLALLPEGCRAIPAGHFNFDPEMVTLFGGKKAHDAINKAIIYQKVIGWIQHNEQHGRNRRDGLNWSYNTYPQWAVDIPVFHQKTIEKHIRDLEAMGLLCSQQFEKTEGRRIKYYGAPVQPSDGVSQMLLWSESKTPMGGALDSALSIHNQTIHKPAMDKQTTPTARARKPVRAGAAAAAVFQPPSENRELPEKQPSMAETRPLSSSDEGRAEGEPVAIEETYAVADAARPLPGCAPPSPARAIDSRIHEFWPTIEADAKLLTLVRRRGDRWTLAVIHYAKGERCDSQPALARMLLEQGFQPPGLTPLSPPLVEPDRSLDDTRPIEVNPNDVPTEPDETPPESEVWKQTRAILERQLGRSFDEWVRLVELERTEGTIWHFSAPNVSVATMLEYRVSRDIRQTLAGVLGVEPDEIELRFAARKAVAA